MCLRVRVKGRRSASDVSRGRLIVQRLTWSRFVVEDNILERVRLRVYPLSVVLLPRRGRRRGLLWADSVRLVGHKGLCRGSKSTPSDYNYSSSVSRF